MGIQERREREKSERKAMIMRCARELIVECGADDVTMAGIAKKAELSKATLYLYFPCKDDLFREICNEAGSRFIEYYRSRHKMDMKALDSLKLYWNCYLELFGKSDDTVMLLNMKQYITPEYPYISAMPQRDTNDAWSVSPALVFFNMIQDILEQGQAEGVFDPDINPALISHTILSLFSMLMERANKNMEKASLALIDDMKNIFQIVLRGIVRDGIEKSLLVLGVVNKEAASWDPSGTANAVEGFPHAQIF
jgi:AcrR family transcriptional regulator